MRKAYILTPLALAPVQMKELKEQWKVEKIVYPPDGLHSLWSSFSPVKPSEDIIRQVKEKILPWLSSIAPHDLVILSGDLCACFLVAAYAYKKGAYPLYPVIKKEVKEKQVGGMRVAIGKRAYHVRFRLLPISEIQEIWREDV